jgi:hypothetical protein
MGVFKKFDVALDNLWPWDIAPAPKLRSCRASHARNSCGPGIVTNRNFLSFGLRQWDGTDAAIALAFEQQARMFLIRLLCGANGISDALRDFGDIRLPERGDGNGMPIAIDGNGFERRIL